MKKPLVFETKFSTITISDEGEAIEIEKESKRLNEDTVYLFVNKAALLAWLQSEDGEVTV